MYPQKTTTITRGGMARKGTKWGRTGTAGKDKKKVSRVTEGEWEKEKEIDRDSKFTGELE